MTTSTSSTFRFLDRNRRCVSGASLPVHGKACRIETKEFVSYDNCHGTVFDGDITNTDASGFIPFPASAGSVATAKISQKS